MNHLAHLYLSRYSERMMVGNFIADAVKGKKYSVFDSEIARGILMHREIDTFTDSHFIVKHSKRLLYKRYGLYSSVIVDIFYDHFLAKNFSYYSPVSLANFSSQCYELLYSYFDQLPSRYQRMLPHMKQENWLIDYGNIEGTQRSLTGMSHRIKYNPGIQHATTELRMYYKIFNEDFHLYFPLLEEHISGWYKKTKKTKDI
ncbi:MAG: DUF479 domain-containing protein [Chitinophagales bacterium]|nr:DUF479 domain-containing protein [Chitinophagales bacterium]